ncbi:CTP synthase [Neolewinella lacunae]|uniref:CTP synthase n=1 Tax=Neolewinella lacunae TaxID=1517758 RepID=A0A923PJE2_9BACT|nr:CTP synthase [Neolewinella lacunae]MBC6993665.1 CTP synthase [Neolewinella lacunae]MDN3636360.1 CTP synthase [Neolewinella lacunae]
MSKYIFVTGGVTSSLGKGIIAASLAKLLQARGLSVTIQKFDPYLNVDPGTLNPIEHGECYVTDDGAETDLDLGHYERFLNTPTSQANNVTTGRIYQTVIEMEREGAFLGKTVQVVPHVTDEIKRRVQLLGQTGEYDIVITELGGTVGDIESLPYLESLRQLRWELGRDNCVAIHLTLIPYLAAAKELKTKPTQHSVKELLSAGIQPDILVVRTEHPIDDSIRRKLALFCNVEKACIIEAIDASTIYDVPLLMLKEGLDAQVISKLRIQDRKAPDLRRWKNFLGRLKNSTGEVTIGLVGKYIELRDAYKSIYEAFIHAGAVNECKVKVIPVNSEQLEGPYAEVGKFLDQFDGILVAPGFGERGIEGKIAAIQYIRENQIPFFGICLGMQCAVVEFSRNVAGIAGAGSSEVDPKVAHPVIDLMNDQKKIKTKGGTMRLGAYACTLAQGSKTAEAYGTTKISERHRHRYEFNNAYLDQLKEAGLKIVGTNPDTGLVEVIELEDHPYFVGVQFHPELKSTVENPHPLFVSFVAAALVHREKE